jgi:hypothetical protein
MPRTPSPQPIPYRGRQRRVWYVSEVARLKVVSASIDGPNLCLVIRFELDGEERFSRWIGGDEWIERTALHRLFAEAEPADATQRSPVAGTEAPNDLAARNAPIEAVVQWVQEVASMGPDELEAFEQQTFAQWDRGSLVAVRRAIDRRRRELAG